MTNHETVKHLRDAQRRLRSVLVANADRLSTPFTDDPSKNPWDTYLRPAVRGLQEAVNAACEALAAPAAVSVPPPAPRADDQAALRQRIAAAIRDAACPGDCGKTEEECAKERIQPFVWHHGRLAVVEGTPEMFADAVLAVLPDPADQAAALNRAADEVFALDYDAMVGEEGDENLGSMREAWDLGTVHATLLLRRLADEARQPEPHPSGAADEEQPEIPGHEWCKCNSCWGWFVEDHPGEDLDDLGRDLGWWSGLPVHRDAPAGVAGGQQNETPEAAGPAGVRLCDGCGHLEHRANKCPATRYRERCACDEPVAVEAPE